MKHQLKKLSFLGLLAAIAILQSCTKIDILPTITVPWNGQSLTMTVDPMGVGVKQNFQKIISTPANLDSLIKAKNSNMSIKNIKHITIDSVLMTINNPDPNNNWGNFGGMEMFLTDAQFGNPNLVTYNDNMPSTYSTKLTLPTNSSVDLINYLNTSGGLTTFYYEFEARVVTPTTVKLNVTMNVYYKITAGAN